MNFSKNELGMRNAVNIQWRKGVKKTKLCSRTHTHTTEMKEKDSEIQQKSLTAKQYRVYYALSQ